MQGGEGARGGTASCYILRHLLSWLFNTAIIRNLITYHIKKI